MSLVRETGDLFFIDSDSTTPCLLAGFGKIGVGPDGSSFVGTAAALTDTFATLTGVNNPCSYPGGSNSVIEMLSGTFVPRSSVTITVTGVAGGFSLGTEHQNWNFSSLYTEPPSLSALAGSYADDTDTFQVYPDGTVLELAAATGCVISGSIQVMNPLYNAYEVSITVSSCTSHTELNGVVAEGMAYLDDSASPAKLVLGVHNDANTLMLVGRLPRLP